MNLVDSFLVNAEIQFHIIGAACQKVLSANCVGVLCEWGIKECEDSRNCAYLDWIKPFRTFVIGAFKDKKRSSKKKDINFLFLNGLLKDSYIQCFQM